MVVSNLATLSALLAVAAGGLACRGPDAPETSQPYRDYLYATAQPRSDADVQALWRDAEYVLSPHTARLGPHELVVLPSTVTRLRALGIEVVVEPIDVQALIDKEYEQRRSRATPHGAQAGTLGLFGPFFQQVQELDAIYQYLDELVAASEGRAQVMTIGKSIQNRDIKAIRVSTTAMGTDRPSVIITGTQHAREWASPMVTTGLADAIVRQYSSNPQVKAIVDELEIFIVPVVNPDGYVASHNGQRLQRKNMNPVCNVDLNRNWGEWWGMGTPVNGCGQETYPGKGAFSEPETQAVKALAESRKNLRFYMDYHSAADQVMYPLCFIQTKSPDGDEDKAWAAAYSKAFTSINGARLPAQSCFGIGGGEGGCSTDWFRRRLPNGLEVELRSGGSLSGFGISNDLVLPFVEENWSAWIGVLTKVAQKYPLPSTPPIDAGEDAPTDGGASSDQGPVPATDGEVGGASDGSPVMPVADGGPTVVEVQPDEAAPAGTTVDAAAPEGGTPGRGETTAQGSGCALAGAPSGRADCFWSGLILGLLTLHIRRSSRRSR